MRREWERLWSRAWLCAGRLADIPRPGDALTFDIGNASVLVVRQSDGALAAFHNACRHRGRRLCNPGIAAGLQSIRCPFHHWEYSTSGELRRVPGVDLASAPAAAELALVPVACDRFAGFVFINLADDPPPLSEYLADLPAVLAPYSIDDFVVIDDWTIEVDCNWKVSFDTFNEAYHAPAVHPELSGIVECTNLRFQVGHRWDRFLQPLRGMGGDGKPLHPAFYGLLRDMLGVDPEPLRGKSPEAIRRALRDHFAARGIDLGAMPDSMICENWTINIFPNITMTGLLPGKYMFLRHRPHPSDPQKMLLDYQEHARPGSERQRPRPQAKRIRHGDCKVSPTLDQDLDQFPLVQAGLGAPGLAGCGIHPIDQEVCIRHMHGILDAYLEGGAR
jgi:nitrite reductase/ring-hydroxylating ferredoxin subunit